jgi:hypothetical protein
MKADLLQSRVVFFLSFLLMVVLTMVGRSQAQPSSADTVRFLEQATFGPSQSLIAHVQQVGMEAYLDEQLRAPRR